MTNITSKTFSRSLSESYGEGLRYFEGKGMIHHVLQRLASDLRKHNIDYVVIGGVALLANGYHRYTENIDLVLTTEGLEKFNKELLGLGGWGLAGYTLASLGQKRILRSYPEDVMIEVRTAGEYPGDGKPKPVSFPNPPKASVEIDGVRFATLEKLIELKLASGMTAPDRLKDLADVQEMIKIRSLDSEFAGKLNPYVQEKYLELLAAVDRGRSNNIQEQL